MNCIKCGAGDWIYYDTAGEFYRMKTDGSENQKVE